MKSNQVWIVISVNGESADRTKRIVAAFPNYKEASDYAEACDKEQLKIWNSFSGVDTVYQAQKSNDYIKAIPPKYDPSMHFDYTGVSYYVEGPIPFHQKHVVGHECRCQACYDDVKCGHEAICWCGEKIDH